MRAYWDFQNAPITFDCITFFAIAFQLMQKAGDAHWDLTVFDRGVFRQRSDKDSLLSQVEKERRVEHLFKPLLKCLRGLRSYIIFQDTNPELGAAFSPPYLGVNAVKLFNEGYDPRVIQVPEFAKWLSTEVISDTSPFVTFTCRLSRYQPLRNTNLVAFEDVARYLKTLGIISILIPDVESEIETIGNPDLWRIGHSARHNFHIRLGLYSRAICNISTGGGAAGCLWYSQLPFISTIPSVPTYPQGNPKGWSAIHGTNYGDGYPWFAGDQRFVFGKETSSAIIPALSEILSTNSSTRVLRS